MFFLDKYQGETVFGIGQERAEINLDTFGGNLATFSKKLATLRQNLATLLNNPATLNFAGIFSLKSAFFYQFT